MALAFRHLLLSQVSQPGVDIFPSARTWESERGSGAVGSGQPRKTLKHGVQTPEVGSEAVPRTPTPAPPSRTGSLGSGEHCVFTNPRRTDVVHCLSECRQTGQPGGTPGGTSIRQMVNNSWFRSHETSLGFVQLSSFSFPPPPPRLISASFCLSQ